MDTLRQDVAAVGRLLRKQPVLVVCAVALLALGVAVTTAVFSVVNAALLRPFPHLELDRWARLYEQPLNEGLGPMSVSVANYRDWKQQSQSFSEMVLWETLSLNLSDDHSEPERVQVMILTADVFHTLALKPAAGRLLNSSDDPAQQGDRPVLISHGLWQRRFGGDPAIVGRQIHLNLRPYLVVGVAPRDFSLPPDDRSDVWVPQSQQAIATNESRDARGLQVAGLLRPGVTWAAAQAEMDVIARRLAADHRENEGFGVRIVPMREDVTGTLRAPLIALLGALGLVLLLVSVNVASLQLVRLEARRREFAVRAALGASRGRLLRETLTESVLIAGAAGVLGVALAPACIELLLALVPSGRVSWLLVSIDGRVLLVSAGLTGAVTAIAGLLPASRAVQIDVAGALARGGRTGSPAAASRRLRNGFVVAQVALSFVLIASAILLGQSFVRLKQVEPGFTPRQRLTFSYMAPMRRYPDTAALTSLAHRIRDEVRQLPGVRAAGAAQALPFAEGAVWFQAFSRTDPKSVPNVAVLPHVHYNVVTPGYAEALAVPLKTGRTFTDADTAGAEPVVLINEALAARFFPNESPIGQQVWVGHAQALPTLPPRTVVGVVGDARWEALDTPAGPEAWVPLAQQVGGDIVYRTLLVVLETAGDPRGTVPAVRAQVGRVDKDLALASIRTLEDRLDENVWRHRLAAGALGGLGIGALVMALLGVFAATNQLVNRRIHEMGVRIALGAHPRAIVRLVVSETGRLVLLGIVFGVGGALLAAGAVASLLYGVGASDARTLAGTGFGLASIAFLASYVPARRAARVDPLTLLRPE